MDALETILKFEGRRPMRESNKAKLMAVFDVARVEILNGDSPGARLRLARKGSSAKHGWAPGARL